MILYTRASLTLTCADKLYVLNLLYFALRNIAHIPTNWSKLALALAVAQSQPVGEN